MPEHSGARELASVQSSFSPLVALLERELARYRVSVPLRNPRNLGEFTRWYLEVVQLLERQVAGESGREPMARDAVEMMCRCAMSAADVRGAIDLCARYSAVLYPRAGVLTLTRAGDAVSLQLDSLRLETTTASSLVDITGLFAFRQLLQWLAGRELPLSRVCIGPIQRDDVLPFLKLFRAPVLAGGERYSLEFDPAVLDWPCVRGRAEFDTFFELFPCAVFGLRVSDLGAQVCALMVAALERGEGPPTQARLADILEIPLSTLRGRLRDEGSGYRQLREQCLSEMAARLLARGDLSVTQVAARLGFSDPGSFRRAFHQWHGCSPRARGRPGRV
ncbi:helix-turn-helix transcriptional regulator [Parahaliea mediterranea]|uniref:AraC family transcriptional regulator ligand-binding domain-containing protein n=1 Tax=Parahaliea mediterranea TaxID=651086 RepID=A0A939DEM3_9GAMM|nr:AraC family transcriptional regulator [Parahaliea mediterranea]MBN7796720.1 AraC family transcriptional regulator ligand-binding domain-containing protein [Parahaliea mediterranea]